MNGLALIHTFQELESPRLRDVERRFLQRAGWKAVFTNKGWRWKNSDYKNSLFTRGRAFALELEYQSK